MNDGIASGHRPVSIVRCSRIAADILHLAKIVARRRPDIGTAYGGLRLLFEQPTDRLTRHTGRSGNKNSHL